MSTFDYERSGYRETFTYVFMYSTQVEARTYTSQHRTGCPYVVV